MSGICQKQDGTKSKNNNFQRYFEKLQHSEDIEHVFFLEPEITTKTVFRQQIQGKNDFTFKGLSEEMLQINSSD